MTGDIVNLRSARKARDRVGREATAAANRLAHGRTRAEREASAQARDRIDRQLDGHRLTGRDGEDA